MRSATFIALLVLSPFALAACGEGNGNDAPAGDGPAVDEAPPAADAPDPTELEYAPELGVDFDRMERTSSGLYVDDVEEGEGAAAEAGQVVSAHYTGSFPDGRVFDTSRENGEPIMFPLGEGMVIPGWDEGLQGMRPGGRRLLVIPPDLAYGPEGADGVIPPNATLVFDVELVEVH